MVLGFAMQWVLPTPRGHLEPNRQHCPRQVTIGSPSLFMVAQPGVRNVLMLYEHAGRHVQEELTQSTAFICNKG